MILTYPVFEELAVAHAVRRQVVCCARGHRSASGTIVRSTEVRENLWREPIAFHLHLVAHDPRACVARYVLLLTLHLIILRSQCC